MYIPIIVPKKNTKNQENTTCLPQNEQVYSDSKSNNNAEILCILIVIVAVIMFALTIKENKEI